MDPKDYRFTKEHEWVYVDGDVAVIGISDYAAGELGDIVYVELPEKGSKIKQMDPIGTIEAVKTVADLYSPVSGEVIEVNEEIVEHPEMVNGSPYEDGWFIKVKIEDPGELDVLFSYDEYQDYLGEQESEEEEGSEEEEE
ncbi:MAG: glycine cleavage system protein H [Candidatus Latescibacteria bacterium 4484_7]|nr:MAG: glycine cleavage system protein H [Candidatus Latescibacteria bacterium 4484_7]RKZ06719.1 MAG: glycine cleavage system protein GcvH [bacterium]